MPGMRLDRMECGQQLIVSRPVMPKVKVQLYLPESDPAVRDSKHASTKVFLLFILLCQ